MYLIFKNKQNKDITEFHSFLPAMERMIIDNERFVEEQGTSLVFFPFQAFEFD